MSKKSKRNSRQRAIGAAPVPTPLILPASFVSFVQELGVGVVATFTVKYGGILDGELAEGELISTDRPPRFIAFDAGANPIVCDSAVVNEDGELVLTWNEGSGVPLLGTVLTSAGFDPSIRTRRGGWIGPFYIEIAP